MNVKYLDKNSQSRSSQCRRSAHLKNRGRCCGKSLRSVEAADNKQAMPEDQEEPEKQKITKLDTYRHELGQGHAIGQNEAGGDKGGNQDTDIEQLSQILHESPST